MKELLIGKSYLEEHGDRVRLCANVSIENENKIFYFEVNQRYRDYLCQDRADPFITALLNFSQTMGYDINCEQPVTERLLYQLQNYYLPIVYKANKKIMYPISIMANIVSEPIKSEGKVISSASGGVDSFYTIVKHISSSDKYKLTHLFVTNYFNTYKDENDCRKRFIGLKERISRIANSYGLELYDVYTNMYDFWYPNWVGLSSMKYASCLLAAERLFSVVYAPSSYEIINFTFKHVESLHYDLFNMKMLCSDNISFYSSGGECSRLDKLKYIARDSVVQKELLVCNFENYNCSECDKCMRTEYGLYAIGALNEFSNVFDLKKFEKQKFKYLVKILRRRGEFDKEIIREMKDNKIEVPFIAKIIALVLEPINWIKILVEKSKILEKLYYDTLIYRIYNGEKVSRLTRGNRAPKNTQK